MNEFEKVETVETETPTETIDVKKVVAEMLEKEVAPEQILEAVKKMVEEGKLTEDDYKVAEEMLDKKQAEQLFDMEIR